MRITRKKKKSQIVIPYEDELCLLLAAVVDWFNSLVRLR